MGVKFLGSFKPEICHAESKFPEFSGKLFVLKKPRGLSPEEVRANPVF